MKKLLSMVMTMLFVASISFTAMATTNTGVITIKNNPETTGIKMTEGEFSAIKIFNLELGVSGSNKKYSYKVDTDFEKFFKAKAGDSTDVSTEAKLNKFAIDYVDSRKDDMQDFAKEIREYVKAELIIAEGKNGEVRVTNKIEETSLTGLALGYYIVLNEKSESESVIAAAIGTTDTELVVNLKGSAPTIDKEIKHNETGDWGNAGDNAIGDDVEYRLTGTLPSNVTGYKNYTYIIHDELSEGLTFNNDVKVYKDANLTEEITEHFVVNRESDQKFSITVDVLGGVADNAFSLGDKLYFTYSAKLNENAAVAGDSNDNKVYLEYSNNPYEESTKDTVEVIVKDYTFKLKVFKTGEDGETALEGAKFEIHRDGKAIHFKVKAGEEFDTYVVCTDETHGSECTTEIISPKSGKFEIVGLDDSVEYTLKETQAPDGYNEINDIKFTIKAEYNEDGSIKNISTNVDGIVKEDSSFALTTKVVNTTGIKLPETGGMGTTIFTIVGGILMVSAAAVVIKNKKN